MVDYYDEDKMPRAKTRADKYFVGDIGFPTKEACKVYVRAKINELRKDTIDKKHKDFVFFVNLLNIHQNGKEKIGCGIECFYVRKNDFGGGLQTWIKRTDGTREVFSWNKCCFKKKSNDEDLTKAMRNSVSDVVSDFKINNAHICKICGTASAKEYHTDHDNPSFQKLKKTFLENTTRDKPTEFDENPFRNYTTIFRREDADFENEWVNYHNTNCNLQILCSDCNLRKAKN